MNITHALAPHLPYLRRYARALTGSQNSGDAYVRAALTALARGRTCARMTIFRPVLRSIGFSTRSGRVRHRITKRRRGRGGQHKSRRDGFWRCPRRAAPRCC